MSGRRNETTSLIDGFFSAVGWETGPAAPVAEDHRFDEETLDECLRECSRPETRERYGEDLIREGRRLLRALKRIPEIERVYVA